MARVIRRLQTDYSQLINLLHPIDSARRRRSILLHAIKVGLIQRIAVLSTAIPSFSPQQGVTRDDILEWIIGLDVPNAVGLLNQIFPIREADSYSREDFGEVSDYRSEAGPSYEVEHRTVLDPLLSLYELVRLLGSAIHHEIGAVG